ncbi:HD-GYP domain-containing protein [Solidesulfovibrio sp.]
MLQSPLLESHGVLDVVAQVSGQDNDVLMALVHQLAASLGKAIDAKDPHTMAHSEEVAEVAKFLAAAMGLPGHVVTCVHVAGHLHDIGKIGVPDAVLGKPGSLDADEWECMKAHPAIGAEILLPLACFAPTGIVDMVRAHHERFDGGGYPLGLSGRAIPLGARIISVADSLSAMLQTRPYRPAMGFADARLEIVRCAGSQFDPDVVDAFLAVAGDVRRLLGSCRGGELVP